jgi:hypothetical protein
MAGAIAGTAFAGLTALTLGTAAPAGAQPIQPVTQTASAAPQHATVSQGCWDDCWDDWGWDSWSGGWDSWNGGWHSWGWWGW